MTTSDTARPVRRAIVLLATLAVGGLLLAMGAVAALDPSLGTPTAAPAGAPEIGPAIAPAADGLPGDAAALATRPMPILPIAAALPAPLVFNPAPPLRLPAPTGQLGTIPAGFPASGEGAVAALAALNETALRGGDPEEYSATYQRLAAPGAPPTASARLTGLLRNMRAAAGLPATGPVPHLDIDYQVSEAQIKGVLDSGRFAVVCVLGQLGATYQGQFITAGVGDCQAMQHLGGTWLIAPGPPAATAPDAWPGSQSALDAGYRGIER